MSGLLAVLIALLALDSASGGAGSERLREHWLRAREPQMLRVGPGTLRPFYPSSPAEREVAVAPFWLDRVPVTQAEFARFVRARPEWRRDRVSRLLAEPGYLASWEAPRDPGAALDGRAPVVEVSWFAARAYCAARGARLPSEAEWELAAQASEHHVDARDDPEFRDRLLAWYAVPASGMPGPVGAGTPNYWGVHDLHGLVWEWVLDFNSTLLAADGREAGGSAFCGAGALVADEKQDYPSFLRLAFRSSLAARYVTRRLGFRCARSDAEAAP